MSTSQSPGISKDEVLRIAKLAHLDLNVDEVAAITHDLSQILDYVKTLREVDVTGVPPMSHVDSGGIVPRLDEEEPSLSHDAALREAPSVDEGGFRVPAFVDEG